MKTGTIPALVSRVFRGRGPASSGGAAKCSGKETLESEGIRRICRILKRAGRIIRAKSATGAHT